MLVQKQPAVEPQQGGREEHLSVGLSRSCEVVAPSPTLACKKKNLKSPEDVCVFSFGLCVYIERLPRDGSRTPRP